MSNNITEQEFWRLYVLFMSIPNETWTDILKLLSRRILVQKISPVCYRLKEICNRNVESIHVITEAGRFNEKLQQADPEANQQLQYLAGNNCQLASQFRLTRTRIIQENMAVLRHCNELFRGCRLTLFLKEVENVDFTNECLTQLEAAKSIAICISLLTQHPQLFNQFLRHPTIWSCTRIEFSPAPWALNLMPIAASFLDWLHHQQQPIGVDDSGDGAEPIIRCLIIQCICDYDQFQGAIDWLIDGCIRNFQQSQGQEDRRRFVLNFPVWSDETTHQLNQFERRQHNQMSGEVLLLELDDASNQFATKYRLRRCLAEDASKGTEFYGKTFKQNGLWDEFVVNDGDGPMVAI